MVQVEQAMDEADTILVSPGGELGLDREKGGGPPTLQGVSFFRTEMDGRHCRMAVVAQSEEEALTVIERSASLAESGIVSPKTLRSLAQRGIFMSREDLPALPLALVFPGQGSQYGGMGRELYESFPVIREWMDRAAAVAEFDLLHLIVPRSRGEPSEDPVAATCHVRHGTCHGAVPHDPRHSPSGHGWP